METMFWIAALAGYALLLALCIVVPLWLIGFVQRRRSSTAEHVSSVGSKIVKWWTNRDVSSAEARAALTMRGWATILLWTMAAIFVLPLIPGTFSVDTFAVGGTYLTIVVGYWMVAMLVSGIVLWDGITCLLVANIGRQKAKDEADTAFFVCEDHMHLASTTAVVHVGDDECDGHC